MAKLILKHQDLGVEHHQKRLDDLGAFFGDMLDEIHYTDHGDWVELVFVKGAQRLALSSQGNRPDGAWFGVRHHTPPANPTVEEVVWAKRAAETSYYEPFPGETGRKKR